MAFGLCPIFVTDVGYVAAASAQASGIVARGAADIAIQIGVALYERNSSRSISNMQTDLADRQMLLAERVQAHAILFWPEEAELVSDVFAETRATAVYALGTGWGEIAESTLAQARLVWLETSRQECFVPDRCDDARWQRNATMNQVDVTSYGFRQSEARMEILNDRRYARQLTVLGLGRGLANTLTSYQSVSQYSGLSAGDMLDAGISKALLAFNYHRYDPRTEDGWAAQSSLREVYAPGTVGTPVKVSTPLLLQRPAAASTMPLSDSTRARTESLPFSDAPRSKQDASNQVEREQRERDLRARMDAEVRGRGRP
jgi:hypothetical protein